MARYFNVGGCAYQLLPWQPEAHSLRQAFWYHNRVTLGGLPMHAWTDEALRQLFRGIAVYDRMTSASYERENTRFCSCWIWTHNPDLLPLLVACTLLP